MKTELISHRSILPDCFALNEDEIAVRIHTGKDVTAVELVHDDPFAGGAMGFSYWEGKPQAMELTHELSGTNIWTAVVRPQFKREQYYFRLHCGSETQVMFEDGCYSEEDARKPGRLPQFFRYPWLNPADVIKVPQWVRDTVWYQIMPDRFCKSGTLKNRNQLKEWSDDGKIGHNDIYGGDLRGIIDRLPYIKDLGVNGFYLTPIFLSNTNHKYNTFDYTLVDPDFGTEEDVRELIEKAHKLGMKVMLDAVFNHSGVKFAPWQDVLKNGENSKYKDWFFVNQWPAEDLPRGTDDGRFYSFAFTEQMPKLNTNNEEVQDYLIGLCRRWLTDYRIDGIRYDVGNEVSHAFLKRMHKALKAVNPEVFMLGEIWHDSLQWLEGDEYDSVMNYPFMESLQDFHVLKRSARELMYSLNRVECLYARQTFEVMFNALDTHDTMRAVTRCGSLDVYFEELALLLTYPGTPCMFAGSELGLEGGGDPLNRRTMPWEKIEQGEFAAELAVSKALIALRRQYKQLSFGALKWLLDDKYPYLVSYERTLDGEKDALRVLINCGEEPVALPEGKVLFSRYLKDGILPEHGIAVLLTQKA